MRLLHTLIQAMVLLLLITSCDKPIEVTDDGTVISNEGFVQVDSNKYEMTQLIVQKGKVRSNHGGREYQIYLLDDGYMIHLNQDQEIDSVSGIGNYTTFKIISSDSLQIQKGDYPYKVVQNKTQIFSICASFFDVEFGEGILFDNTTASISTDGDGLLSIQSISTSSLTFGISGVCVTDSVYNTPYQVYYSGGYHFEDMNE